ncbi:MAG: hypothetical protein AAGM84_00530 [Pseudomonadota bacterium]
MRVLAILLLLWAGPANAGPWLREAGTGFFALSGTVNERYEQGTSLYVDYGLRARLTIGAELDLTMPGAAPLSGSGRVFARMPLADGTWIASWHVGLGGRDLQGRLEPFASGGVSIGRGLNWKGRMGWLAFDTRVDLGTSAVRQFKLDTTFGMQIGQRGKGMLQLFVTADNAGDLHTTLAPSYVFTPKQGGPSYQLGLEAKRSKKTELGLKLGLWRKF